MKTKIEIQKGIPIPESNKGRRPIYPFETMKVGDSFIVEGTDRKNLNKLNSSASRYKVENKGFNYSIRKEEGGYRIWRIEVKKVAVKEVEQVEKPKTRRTSKKLKPETK